MVELTNQTKEGFVSRENDGKMKDLPCTLVLTLRLNRKRSEGTVTTPISAKYLELKERVRSSEKRGMNRTSLCSLKKHRRLARIVAIAKATSKPAFQQHLITKEEYKRIMREVVTKARKYQHIDPERIRRMVVTAVQNCQ